MTDRTIDIIGRRPTFLPASAVRRLNDAIEALIALVDELAPDCDLEEDDPPGDDAGRGYESADTEPSLGATTAINQDRAWKAAQAVTDLEFDGDGVSDPDLEDGNDRESASDDEEPSLAATNDINQVHAWRLPEGWHADDAEEEHNGSESEGYMPQPLVWETARPELNTAIEKLSELTSRSDDCEYGRMFRPDEDVRMPDGTTIMGYVR